MDAEKLPGEVDEAVACRLPVFSLAEPRKGLS
jgi:hypothetical protein